MTTTTYTLHGYELIPQTPADVLADRERQAKRERREAMLTRQAQPLRGTAGDLTADMFGDGDMPLFDKRRQ